MNTRKKIEKLKNLKLIIVSSIIIIIIKINKYFPLNIFALKKELFVDILLNPLVYCSNYSKKMYFKECFATFYVCTAHGKSIIKNKNTFACNILIQVREKSKLISICITYTQKMIKLSLREISRDSLK